MKKTFCLTVLLLLAGVCALSQEQSDYSVYPNPALAEKIAANPAYASLNACPYDCAVVPGPDTRAPRGYKPFYISHYGRHGSRSGWDGHRYESLIATLQAAKEEGVLSERGDSLLSETITVQEAFAGMEGRLTPRGQREHRSIADRMYSRFARVFRRGNRQVRALSSQVPRCLVSMASFTNQLERRNPKLKISLDCGEKIQKMISNDATDRIEAEREVMMDSLRNAMCADWASAVLPLFTDSTAAARLVPDFRHFASRVFSVARTSRSFDVPFNMNRYLPLDVIYAWMDYYNMRMYLGHCNSLPFGDERMETCAPLAKDIVDRADEAILGQGPAADLRFGHDYPLLALESALGIEGVGERYSLAEAREHFCATVGSPFAGNVQLVFYRSRKRGAPVLVKVLMNESEARLLDLEPFSGPYYRWEELRECLLAKISR